MTSNRLLAIGGAHIDRRGRISGPYVPGASNPGVISEDVGGGVFNALRNAIRHGVLASLLSVRGGDSAGENVERAIAGAGIDDLSAVFLDRSTPSYTALLDSSGELIAGLADMDLYEFAFAKQVGRSKAVAAIANASAILCDANLPEPALRKVIELATDKPLFAIAISPAKVTRLVDTLDGVSCLFMNIREAASLASLPEGSAHDIAAKLLELGLAGGVITAGARPVIGFDHSGMFQISPPSPRLVADVTGAGDALAGVTIAGMMKGQTLRHSLRKGVAAAMLAVESRTAVADYSDRDFAAALEVVPPAEEMP